MRKVINYVASEFIRYFQGIGSGFRWLFAERLGWRGLLLVAGIGLLYGLLWRATH